MEREGGAVGVVGDAGVEDRLVLAAARGELAALGYLEAVALGRLPDRRISRSSQAESAASYSAK